MWNTHGCKYELLDIDDYGSVIPLKDLELKIPADESVMDVLNLDSLLQLLSRCYKQFSRGMSRNSAIKTKMTR